MDNGVTKEIIACLCCYDPTSRNTMAWHTINQYLSVKFSLQHFLQRQICL